jgi:prophage antirepressor-like protein
MSEQQAIVKAFEFETQAVRVELFDGEPWWVAKDVAVALGYAETSVANNMSNLVAKVPAEWRGNKPFLTPGGTQEILCLSEQGLYSFLARSNMEAAVPFQKWIAGEVLPSIRKTGKYSVVPVDPTALGLPDFNDPFAAAEAWAKEGRGRVAAEEQAKGVAA